MTASLLETFYDKMLGIQHYSSFVYPVCRSFSFICGIVVMCRCDVGAVGLLKHTLQWKRKIRAKFRHKKTRLKLLKDTDSVVQTSNNLKLSKPFTLNQIQSLAKGQHWQEETKKIPLNPSTTNFPSAAPASEKKERELAVMEDLLMKKGEARTFGVIKGDRERVTVGLRQKSCSIAGRNIKRRVHRKTMQPCLKEDFLLCGVDYICWSCWHGLICCP